MYKDRQYAMGRLLNTILQIRGNPCYVNHITGDMQVRYTDLITDEESGIQLDDPSLDLSPIELGYVNFKRGASYLIREAARRWKQGTDNKGIVVRGADNRTGDWFLSRQFLNCIADKYPSVIEALIVAEEEGITVAFNRKFAVSSDGSLYYRGIIVGKYDNTFTLNKVYSYLQEILEEAL